MPLANLSAPQAVGAGAVVLAVIGLVTAAITHSEDLARVWEFFAGDPEMRLAAGSWRGVYKDFDQKGNEIIQEELVQLEQGGSGLATATPQRPHKLKWTLKDGYFLAQYQDKFENQIGAAVYVLRGRANSALEGFWTGYDTEKRTIVSCPYVLARGPTVEEMKSTYAARLAKSCTH